MNIHNLTIDDWFNFLIDIEGGDTEYDPKNEIYQPMQIVSLTVWGNNDGEVESAEGVINDIDQVKPILLTVEILEKNGFIRRYEIGDEVIWKSEDLRIELTDDERMHNTYNKWSVHIDTEDMSTMFYCELTYVHELQHVLRFCEIDKEIKI